MGHDWSDVRFNCRVAQRRWREALFWGPLLLAAVLIAVWPPHTVDGPAHLLGASVLTDWDAVPVYREFYLRDLAPTPNLGGNLLLAGLLEVLGLGAAETVVLIVCAVGLPLALRAAVVAVRPENGWAAIAVLPFGFGYLYFYGFYGFCLGLVLFLGCVAVALRARRSPWRDLALTVLLTATWFTHLVPFVLAVATVSLLALTADRRPVALVRAAIPMLPGFALTAAYAFGSSQGDGPEWSNPLELLGGLVTLHSPLVALHWAENPVTAALAVLLMVVVAWRTRRAGDELPTRRGSVCGIALAAGAATLLYLAAPNSFGIDFGLINERLSLFPVLLGLLWLLVRAISIRAAAVLALGSVLAAAALFAVRVPELRRIDRLADEYATAAPMVAGGSTLIALRFAEFTPDSRRNRRADPVRHLSSLLAARTGSVDVGHYEAVLDYFPARFRAGTDPRRAIDPTLEGLGQVPPRVDLAALPARVGHVLLIGTTLARIPTAMQAVAEVRNRLQVDFVRVGVTGPTGLVEVWRSRALR